MHNTTDLVVDIAGLRKNFGSFTALDGLDLTVRAGEIAGFLGPNGSGKSTTIRTLLGMYRPDGGRVTVFGADPLADAVAIHQRLAYVPGDVNLWPQLSGGECIDLLLSLRGVRREATTRRAELIDRFELDPTKKSGTYSTGNRQKVALIAALSAPSELLVLDEPTSGLDPLMTREFTDCVREAAAGGAAVLMSSHLLDEVEQLCESVTIIRGGRTIRSGSLSELRHLRRSRVTATIGSGASQLQTVPGVHDFEMDGDQVTFTVADDCLSGVTRVLAHLEVTGLAVEPPSLEELFLHVYGDRTGVRV
ncbi:ATP-binding cassette domain-containing protein [Gordonia sp. HNM0687]|uniref:ATP-binding cassette domain-containing protein n=1 Tax=Gordonia mangrovi TaxID=2665643 RepID=A0A6L7GTD0_9ACTN|nr:ABC transporter ATP-binding protein [Gordonia mangrovi]MXP22697.1 ATP-binding cassette domain-containing protein [Gordonia mangrovi]UVF77021.1 ABC transporter ATP-binding protein [Gordonia mangrovi]